VPQRAGEVEDALAFLVGQRREERAQLLDRREEPVELVKLRELNIGCFPVRSPFVFRHRGPVNHLAIEAQSERRPAADALERGRPDLGPAVACCGTPRPAVSSIGRGPRLDAICEDERVTARVTSRGSVRLAFLVGVALVPLLVATGLGDPSPPISVRVNGRTALVGAGSTLGGLIRTFGLRPDDGRLLDVNGHVLDRASEPGRILVNGVPARRRLTLHEGDTITVVDGEDHTESTQRVITRLPGLRPGDPQYSLSRAHLERVETVGRASGIVVSTAYRPIGRIHTPRAVALTFDDGPWPRSTRAILHVLRKMHVHATFFVVGYLAKRYPVMVHDEIRAGMTIGSHSWDHPEPFDRLGPRRIRAEMQDVNAFLKRRFHVRVDLFRPPGGTSTTRVVGIAGELGLRVVDWNIDPRDWASRATPRSITRAVLSQVKPGSIVDLHDGGGDQRATVRALPSIIRSLRKRGFRLVALG
jgi:peptidoglycan/xylan/chitin deacetylase (PgdA/CDA1 family)/sulfur carrier protein ThiS